MATNNSASLIDFIRANYGAALQQDPSLNPDWNYAVEGWTQQQSPEDFFQRYYSGPESTWSGSGNVSYDPATGQVNYKSFDDEFDFGNVLLGAGMAGVGALSGGFGLGELFGGGGGGMTGSLTEYASPNTFLGSADAAGSGLAGSIEGSMGIPELGMIADAGTAATAAAGGSSGGSTLGAIGEWLGKVSPSTWINVGGNLLGAGINYLGSSKSADALQQGAQGQQDLLRYMYDQNRADLAPWRQAGVGALGNLVNLTTPGKQLDTAMLDPGYAFRQSEGEKGINRAAAARGLWDSGRTYKALDRFNQDYATGEFGNVFNRNAALAGIGQTAVGQGVNAAQNYGTQAGESLLQAANARGSGYVGGANALSGGLSNLLNAYNQQAMLDKILGRR